jgi:preprotein translocase subunit SecF
MSEKSEKFAKIYDQSYKKLLLIPTILLIISLAYLGYFYSVNGDFIKKDVSLTGGITITIESQQEINIDELTNFLSQKLDDFSIKELSNRFSGKQEAVVVQSPIQDSNSSEISDFKLIVEEFLGYELTIENSSVEKTGSKFGESFYKQLIFAIFISFILMALVVFMIFRTFAPSAAVVLSAFADIIMTLALVNFLGIKISSAGIMAFLMLIGYSVDTDIMLTTRLLKRQEMINHKLANAFKTGLTMTLTSIIAITIALIITNSFSAVLSQIFTILLIGLSFDILNTWITNASILKWYLERRKVG